MIKYIAKTIAKSIIFCCFFATTCFATEVKKEIKISTWNIKNFDISAANRTDDEYKRIAKYIELLDADIVALQEVNGEASARVIFPTGYNFYFSNRRHEQRTGIAVRDNIKVVAFENFAKLNIDNSLRPHGQRHGVDIIIEVAGQRLRLLNVHLKSRCWQVPFNQTYNSPDEKYGCDILAAQTAIIKQWIDDRVSEKMPFVILGDFNRRFDVDEHYSPLESMWRQLADGVGLIGVNKNEISACWNGGRYPQYVDHIVLDSLAGRFFVPGSFSQLVFDDGERDEISDHCPISVRMDMGRVDY